MKKGIIIRVPHGLELSSELLHTFEQNFPGYILEPYCETPDYYRSFVRRVNSLCDAFLFLLDAYPSLHKFPLSRRTIQNYINENRIWSISVKGSVDDLHKELEKFTAKLIDTICLLWQCADIKYAVELLNEAEQYSLMSQGRLDLATLVPMKTGQDGAYILQLDESLPPYDDQVLHELKQIKTQKHPKTPTWLRNLEEFKQVYFYNLGPEIASPVAIVQDFNSFLLGWGATKKRALSLHADLQQIVNDELPLPSWFSGLNPQHREMIRILASEPNTIDKQLHSFKKLITSDYFKQVCGENVGCFCSIPQWYWVLPEHQQFFLEHVLENNQNIEDAVSFLPSRQRTLPLPANFAAHSLWAVSADGKMRELFAKRYRSSHIASRDALEWPTTVQQRHTDSNLARVMAYRKPGQLSLLQTLISPIHGADYVPNWLTDFLPNLPPDLELYKLARSAVERSLYVQSILQNNHPYNMAKRLFYTQANDKDSLALLDVAKNYASTTPGLSILLNQYKNVLESQVGTATFFDYAGRELFLSSLEQLIILTLGSYSYGSCVSGKDRKAIELIHTDAMIIYKERFGYWPIFAEPQDKENRIRFVALVADLYMSRHQHEHAGQNAPGSEGIKTPDWYLPADIVAEISKRLSSERALRDDDRFATNNEVKNIFIGGSKKLKEYLLPENKLICRLVARQLGEIYCAKLYEALHSLINEKNLFLASAEMTGRWTVNFFPDNNLDYPEGIKLIRDLMIDTSSGKDNVLRLEKILQIVKDRPKSDPSRTPATNSIYDRLRYFVDVPDTTTLLQAVVDTVEEWKALFNSSKNANSCDALVN